MTGSTSRLAKLLPVIAGVAAGLALGVLLGRGSVDAPPPGGYATAVGTAAPAVVNIYTSKVVTTQIHPLCDLPRFREFCARIPGSQQRMQGSLGSGVIVREDGIVLTNNHVIADADEILVAMADGREARAIVIGTDRETDLAVLRIDLPTPDIVTVAPAESLAVGDVVLAIGNPFGIGQTVSQGIVSALGRYGLTNPNEPNPFEDFIQTDAAVNPGNSGGALVDVRGRLVGVNTLIFSRTGGYEGISFAIPAQLALNVLDHIIEEGEVVRGWLGVEVEVARRAGDEAGGLPVSHITPGGPAQSAGMQPGDLIIAMDDMPVGSAREMAQRIAMLEPGQRVSLGVLRGDRYVELDTVVGRRPVPG
jgi:serine protease DegS